MERNIKILSDREHIYQKTEMYAGGVSEVQSTEYVTTSDGIKLTDVRYVPALVKIINEVIDNAIDVHLKSPLDGQKVVSVKMTPTTVSVSDNGRGIPVRKNEDGIYLPRICWGFARSGGNFDISENTGLGTFGVGSYITNVLSTSFSGETDDGQQHYRVTFMNNAETFTEQVKETKGVRGTTVTFVPDLDRFGVSEISPDTVAVVRQRLLNLKMSFPEIVFKFNNKTINISTFKKYVEQFGLPFEYVETDKYAFAVMHNTYDDFRQFSYVNGLMISDGGSHIDFITANVVDAIRAKLSKRYKAIKPGDIRNKLFVVGFFNDFKNPKFNSQTKEKITNSQAEVSKYFDLDFSPLCTKILKNSGICDPITEVYKIKEEFKRRQELKSLSKVKKIKSDKYLAPIRKHKYLMIVEGECLDEHTEVLTADFTTKEIKDVEVGDVLVNKDLQHTEVKAMTRVLKTCVELVTTCGSVVCGKMHRFFVYDTASQQFCFKAATDLTSDDKLVKSNINSDTMCAEVMCNTGTSLQLYDDTITYTDNDWFIVVRNGKVTRLHAYFVKQGDLVLYS